MILCFFRRIRRVIVLSVLLIALAVYLKSACPDLGKTVGGWISGFEDSRVAQAFSSMLHNLSDGNGLASSVEVFYDNLQEKTAS